MAFTPIIRRTGDGLQTLCDVCFFLLWWSWHIGYTKNLCRHVRCVRIYEASTLGVRWQSVVCRAWLRRGMASEVAGAKGRDVTKDGRFKF
uniref:Uncharacterized protein n=1 Tax=Ixodes ricinus TaxID=34613 RepID=A0A6B0UBH2_IXORI